MYCITVMFFDVAGNGAMYVRSLTGWENEWSSVSWCGERCSCHDMVMHKRVGQGEKRGMPLG